MCMFFEAIMDIFCEILTYLLTEDQIITQYLTIQKGHHKIASFLE